MMTEPRTQSGRTRLMLITALYGDGDPPRWLLDRIADVENEVRAALLDELEAAVRGLVEEAGGECRQPDDPEDPICLTHFELIFDSACEDQPRQLLAVLSLIQQHRETT